MAFEINLNGKIVMVTGVLGRLGKLWSDALLSAGAQVMGLDRVAAIPDDFHNMLKQHPAEKFSYFEANVVSADSLRAALHGCLQKYGCPAVLVNNAGIDQPPDARANCWLFENIPTEVSAAILDVNALGMLRVCQVFGAEMARQGNGSIINIGSLYGNLAPDPRLYEHLPQDPPFLKPPAYGMSKAAAAALSRYLAALWGPRGIRVNTLSPGGVNGGQDATFQYKFSQRVPLRRMAEAADLTGPLLFLASDMSRYVTGTDLLVDGGYSCW